DALTATCEFTLIELEATEAVARASCRKYLPEASVSIVEAFIAYLEAITINCRTTSDPRLEAFEELRTLLKTAAAVVRTAGALRTSPHFLEDFPLLDAALPQRDTRPAVAIAIPDAQKPAAPSFLFSGDRRLSRADSKSLRRGLRALHEVLTNRGFSGGKLRTWRNNKRKTHLDRDLRDRQADFPLTFDVLFATDTETGLVIDCDGVSSELARLWSEGGDAVVTPERVAKIVGRFVPLAAEYADHHPMQEVFDKARTVVAEEV
ncbi:MAG: hypothetical protein ACYC8T_21360, partial [Myxococcaceae bacterium]